MGAAAGTGSGDEPVARAGARFPSAKQLEKLAAREDGQEDGEPKVRRMRGRLRPSGARFPSAKQLERYAEPEPESELAPVPEPETVSEPPAEAVFKPSPVPREFPRPEVREEFWEAGDPPDELAGQRVRPYVITRGRTRSSRSLAIETLVSLRADARWAGVADSTEFQPVRALLQRAPLSLAEVAATLAMPLGVARVLLSDMAELDLLHIHDAERAGEDGGPTLALMRRVLDGLNRL
ncbi:DUF742 domain-containing protein [Amycolatopsis nigrescens]|uniref:DUF742 domain-containing protein n=1 Tax=Amycolatopsis nigrescens TaxID=381445 RepID=UPI0003719040|nr:DUF742 domain-containing protein [Amycolatopsis nigrescens]